MTKISDKQSAILETALRLLVEKGFHNTPMSLIAKEAQVSAGIIYHYFESKEALINELYLEVEAKLAESLLNDQLSQLEGLAFLRQLWLSVYAFYVAHPLETLFLEQYKNSPFYKHGSEKFEEQRALLDQKILRMQTARIIITLPIPVFITLTMGVAQAFAKQQIAKEIELDEATLQELADAVCRSVQVI
jgi:AcrR family transcriptional regulator